MPVGKIVKKKQRRVHQFLDLVVLSSWLKQDDGNRYLQVRTFQQFVLNFSEGTSLQDQDEDKREAVLHLTFDSVSP